MKIIPGVSEKRMVYQIIDIFRIVNIIFLELNMINTNSSSCVWNYNSIMSKVANVMN